MKATIKNEQLKFVNHYGVASLFELKYVAYVANADYAIKMKMKLGKLPSANNWGNNNLPMSCLRENGVFETDKGKPVFELNDEGRKYLAQGRPEHPYIDRESDEYKAERAKALEDLRIRDEKWREEYHASEEYKELLKKREARDSEQRLPEGVTPGEKALRKEFIFMEGKTIKCIRFMTEKENAFFGFYKRPLIFLFDDGTFYIPMSDDEGNDGGSGLFYNKNKSIELTAFSISF